MASTIGSRRFDKGEFVIHKGESWQVCNGGEADGSKHLRYKIRRGSKMAFVRGDKLA